MHLRTHTKPESLGQAGRWQSPYHDTMIDHDKNVGQLLDLLDELGIAENTIVMYTTDNGPHMNTWPDGAMTPFRSEKNTNWEGAFRVPLMVRWPGKIDGGRRLQRDHPAPRLAADVPGRGRRADIVEKLHEGPQGGGKTFKVHIDGYNLLPYLTGEADKSPRKGFIYFNDDGDWSRCATTTGRSSSWSSAARARCEVWAEPFTVLRVPEALQPAHRSLRAGRHHLQHLLGLDVLSRARTSYAAQAIVQRVPGDVQGVPAAPEGGQLHHRPGDREDERGDERRQGH